MTLKQKVKQAQELIKIAYSKHQNGLYVAFSGGKDSRAVLRMTKEIYPNILVIHNSHKGEDIGDQKGVLVVKSPKTNVPKFLALTELTAQLDGTRQDEDDYVMVDGVDIHRSKLNKNYVKSGVFGLEAYFPLFYFTEEEVYEYLRSE